LGVFGLILAVYSNLEKSSPEEKAGGISPEKLKQPLLALLVLFSYPFLLKILGFILSTFLFLFFLFKAMGPRKWFTLVVISLAGSLACYLVFQVWLRVAFPKGILGIG
jgi:putative tricarboxylic transport membrane protein